MDLAEEVARFLQRYSTVGRLGVAVSGGADSVVLLRILAGSYEGELTILHVNHRLRGAESDGDEQFVRELGAELEIRVLVREGRPAPGNLEAEARRVRQTFFQEARANLGLTGVALGHTATDQAETVLFRFLRGSGTAGLAGMAERTDSGLLRPLLRSSRTAVRAFGEAKGWTWREDSSNKDTRFRRNRIRLETMPQLQRLYNERLPEVLAGHAGLARDEERFWAAQVRRRLPRLVRFWADGTAVVKAELFCRYPVALQRRLLRRVIDEVKGNLREIDAPHIEAARQRFSGPLGHDRVQLPGVDVLRSFEQVLIAPMAFLRQSRDYTVGVGFSADYRLPYDAGVIRLGTPTDKHEFCGTVKAEFGEYCESADLDFRRVQQAAEVDGLTVRSWEPGDRLERYIDSQGEKLKDLFQQCRIPLWERRHWPVLASGRQLIWARQFGPAARFAAAGAGETVRVFYRTVKQLKDAIESKVD